MNARTDTALLATPLADASNLPPQAISIDTFLEKYAKGDETRIEQVYARVARALAVPESDYMRAQVEVSFQEALTDGFVTAGRISSAAGTGINATLINCFVQPIGDSFGEMKNGRPGIYTAVAQAAQTMRRGGGVGYDFSQIRPFGAMVKGTHSRASGPVSFMKVFDASCSTVESAGARRGAQMGVLRCDHPDIERFIHAKDAGELSNFNISIGVSDAFMRAVVADGTVELWHAEEPHVEAYPEGAYKRDDGMWVYRTVRAQDLWEQVMRATYDHAEPGILFLDRMNDENNMWYCETIEATNPCGEQPLPPYGSCDLGSINLTNHVINPFTAKARFNYESLAKVVRIGVRMLDNVLDVTYWPLDEQREEALSKRRIGQGFLGLGSTLVMMGVRYNSKEGRAIAAKIAEVMRDESYRASSLLAQEKGSFPKFNPTEFLKSGFAKRLPADIRESIATVGLRNSHLLSIAPTGTIALAFADNASNGIEPAFSWTYNRKKRMADGTVQTYIVEDHAWRLFRHLGNDVSNLPDYFVSALEMSAQDHMKMLESVQPFIDTAISKTVNVPGDYPYSDFKDLYLEGWKAGLKGMATYRPNSILGSVLSVDAPAAQPAETVKPVAATLPDDNPLRKQFDSRPLGDLEGVTRKAVLQTYEGDKTVYLCINFMRVTGIIDGQEITIERPMEFFMPAGQRDEGQQWITSTMRLLSSVARSGGSVSKVLADLREVLWDKGQVRCGFILKDGVKKPVFHDSEVAAFGYVMQQMLIKRGFLDINGNQVPVKVLSEKLVNLEEDVTFGPAMEVTTKPLATLVGGGKKCTECGAHAVQKVDGCNRCMSCGEIGSCS